MSDRYRLQGLKDDVLVATLPKLVARDNEHAADVLAYLAELDARRLYEDMGFSSIWEYCTQALGICQTTAWRKYTAARVCRRFPEMFEAVARGEIQVSVLAELNRYLDEGNAGELFALSRRQSFRHVQQLLAARFPKADVKDSIRRLPERAKPELREPSGASPEAEPRTTALEIRAVPPPDAAPPAVALQVAREPGAVLLLPATVQSAAPMMPMPTPSHSPPNSAHRQVEALSQDRFAVRFTADAEFLALLEQVRGLSAHRDPNGDLLTLLKAGLGARQRELLKQRFAVGRRQHQRAQGAPSPEPASGGINEADPSQASDANGRRPRRHISASVTREVYERDFGQCTVVSARGRRCTARRELELDHIEPWAAGGDDSAANLRLRCRAHNQLGARRFFGKRYIREALLRATKPRRSAGSNELPEVAWR